MNIDFSDDELRLLKQLLETATYRGDAVELAVSLRKKVAGVFFDKAKTFFKPDVQE